MRGQPFRSKPLLLDSKSPQWFKWLAPGLLVKRWLFISLLGAFLTGLGLAIWARRTPIYYLIQFIGNFFETITSLVPSYISGPIAALAGILLIFWGYQRSLGSITEVLMPEGNDELVDVLLSHRRRNRGPKIVAIGGGTGLSTLLRGLKEYSSNITAVVTVADDGGSSGRLRREIGVLPPGDIRNCLTALAGEEKLLTELFQYRFQAGDGLSGHSFGNLFLTALSEITGDLEQAIAASSNVLAIQGRVLPATVTDVRLWAKLADGRYIEGESNITEARGVIEDIGCIPSEPPALPSAVEAIQSADYIIVGPGSLYTSIIPNLLIPGIRDAIARSTAPCIYVCNVMTQPGETDDYTVGDHLQAVLKITGKQLFNAVLVQRQHPSPQALQRYAQMGAKPVLIDREIAHQLNCRLILANLMDEDPNTALVRHNPQRLAKVLLKWYARTRGWN
jgi:uncharacterized cofD-like protein